MGSQKRIPATLQLKLTEPPEDFPASHTLNAHERPSDMHRHACMCMCMHPHLPMSPPMQLFLTSGLGPLPPGTGIALPNNSPAPLGLAALECADLQCSTDPSGRSLLTSQPHHTLPGGLSLWLNTCQSTALKSPVLAAGGT